MFFNLTTKKLDNFPCHYTFDNGMVLNTDEGWEVHNGYNCKAFVKGYANECPLPELVMKASWRHPALEGNYCMFLVNHVGIRLLHDRSRGFPVWIGDKCITNLTEQSDQAWASDVLTIDNNFNIHKSYNNLFETVVENLTDDEIVSKVHEIISESYEKFLTHNTKPLKMFVTGGIDTITSWAYLDSFTKNYELVDYEYLKYTSFYKRNQREIKKFWGYTQIHLWDSDTVLVTGGNGDENCMRGPWTLGQALHYHGVNIYDYLKKDHYMHWYLSKDKNVKLMDKAKIDYPSKESMMKEVLSTLVNDHQHWHIDKTLTFTPFKNIEITRLLLNSSKEQLIAQGVDARVNRKLIARVNPTKICKLSKYKNFNHFENI